MAAEMTRIGVVGGGTMGAGIAQAALQAGLEVVLYDTAVTARESVAERIQRGLLGAVERGKLSFKASETALSALTIAADLGALERAEVIIEAIPELMTAKRALFAQLDTLAPPETILATNTSSLSITAIAAATSRPERVAGMHFFNPVPAMRLVEIIPGLKTAPATIRRVTELATALGKTPVLTKNRPGFLVNRITAPFTGEAIRLLEEGGAEAGVIDALARGMGPRMGPFELLDLIGLDVALDLAVAMHEATFGDPRFRPHPMLKEMVDAGLLGRKSGQGFYEHRTP